MPWDLLKQEAVGSLMESLFPCATLITPNLDEAAVILGERPQTHEDIRAAAHALSTRFSTAVLLKGGHLDGLDLLDILVTKQGERTEFAVERVEGVDTHGSGCTLASAITAFLARGRPLEKAVTCAHAYLQRTLQFPLRVGSQVYLNHTPSKQSKG